MSEPKSKAERIQLLSPWLYHWWVYDDRLGNFRSEAYAVLTPEGKVLIDPLPLTDKALAEIGKVAAICLTQGNHQRSAWSFRESLRVPVYAPQGAGGLEKEPDQWYRPADHLPGELRAIETPGLPNGYSLLLEAPGGAGALFCGDLITRDEDGPYRFPIEPGMDPAQLEAGARILAQLEADSLCPAHGAPCVTGCQQVLQGVLEREGNG